MQNKNKVQNTKTLKRESLIVAYIAVSESELFFLYPNYTYELSSENPHLFKSLLWRLGLDSTLPWSIQENIIHRNRFNQVTQCTRFMGEERQDKEWLESGYASREALDKASGNKILEDLYRIKNCTKDTQAVLESKDIYTEIDKTQWIIQDE